MIGHNIVAGMLPTDVTSWARGEGTVSTNFLQVACSINSRSNKSSNSLVIDYLLWSLLPLFGKQKFSGRQKKWLYYVERAKYFRNLWKTYEIGVNASLVEQYFKMLKLTCRLYSNE